MIITPNVPYPALRQNEADGTYTFFLVTIPLACALVIIVCVYCCCKLFKK